MKISIWITFGTLLVALGCHDSNRPAGVEVDGNRLESTIFPPLTVFVDRRFEYVGHKDFVLYEVAHAKLYVWARSEARQVRQLYWIQFEAYREDNDHHYTYPNSETINIGEFSYYYDPFAMSLERPGLRPGSDSLKMLDILEAQKLELGPGVIGVRLVRLDPESRKELMIIYLEDIAQHEFAIADVQQGGSLYTRWPQISKQLRKRALSGLELISR